jgi:hypothetical protein
LWLEIDKVLIYYFRWKICENFESFLKPKIDLNIFCSKLAVIYSHRRKWY